MDEEPQNIIIDIFPREARFYDVSTVGRVFVFVILFELLEVLTMLFMTITSWSNYILLYLYVSAFLLYFAINSVLNENKYQLFSFILVNTVVSFIEIYQYFISENLLEIYPLIRIISNFIFIPLNITLGYFTFKQFGWRLYRKIGTNIELRRYYKLYQIFLSFLKLDIFFSGLTFGCYSLFFVEHNYEHYIEENKALMFIFIGMSWLTSTYTGYKIYSIIGEMIVKIEPYNLGIPITIFSIVSVIIRILVDYYSIRVYRNFDRGLKVGAF
ncbi:hypothetical protein PPL_12540 [Heterostelium album PN500]|uniref:Uncharacterized protein n=1 Tax=Heterostelium pallidum (strain ATCC 26659 / Pp 5 / PN500) TaxID=670386 RepID=D3BMW7_HETP5|nr:hypothetical protein PPL_12540 [Heterostelium album PN500]EFA77329.1 hypothetical protein PPL_12540 [Heterostelium album PN500]|eukprot:XP_020429458.1 hypothetical protein PPL_12540 [Heterostelium album PN500]